MKNAAPVICLGAAGVMIAAGLALKSADLIIAAALPGGVGLAALINAASQRWSALRAIGEQARLQQLEDRLTLAETELSAANRELAVIREQRAFDMQLQLSQSRSPSAASGL